MIDGLNRQLADGLRLRCGSPDWCAHFRRIDTVVFKMAYYWRKQWSRIKPLMRNENRVRRKPANRRRRLVYGRTGQCCRQGAATIRSQAR